MLARRERQWGSASLWPAARRWLTLAIGVTALWGVVLRPAQAQQFLACGVPMTHHLASGATDTYQLLESGQSATVVDVIDTSGTIGLLQLDVAGGIPSTCNGSQLWIGGAVSVSDCVGNDEGDYAIEFNVIQDSAENCGVQLSCGVAPPDTALNVPGEIDAYTFAGVTGQQVSLTATATSDTTGSLRMRLFSPTGYLQIDSCSGSLTYDVPETGTYTVLVSACITPATGPYTIVWQTLPACAAAAAPALGYVLYTGSRTVGVVNLTTKQTVAMLPGPPSIDPQYGDADNGSITVSPNSGLVYVTLDNSATVSIINTTFNQVVGSIHVPQTYGLRLALDPEGRYAYATLPLVGGIGVINTAMRKIEAVIPIEGYGEESTGRPIAVSPDGKSVYVGAVGAYSVEEGHCFGGSASGSECKTKSDCPGGACGFGGYYAELIVVDTASRTVARRIIDPRLDESNDISFNPVGTLAYVAAGGALSVIDTASGSITQSLLRGISSIAYSHDGRVGYAVGCLGPSGCDTTGLLVIDMASLTITNTVPLADAFGDDYPICGIALSPDEGRLLVTNWDAMLPAPDNSGFTTAAVVIDTTTQQVVGTIPTVGDNPYSPAIVTPPTGLCTADASGQTRVTVGELVSAVTYSVDGCPTAVRIRPATAQ
jgi:DNA-binding beta-propeller fold protein YncE